MLIGSLHFVLLGVGLTNLLINASILDAFRSYFVLMLSYIIGNEQALTLSSCMMCAGFWVGLFLAVILGGTPFQVFSAGCIVSLSSNLYDRVSYLLDALGALISSKIE